MLAAERIERSGWFESASWKYISFAFTARYRARRQRIVTMFGHYLAPAMVERLQNNPELLKLGGEVRELTVLFCDVRGFTTISEHMQTDPERLTQLVNRILTALSRCVLAEIFLEKKPRIA